MNTKRLLERAAASALFLATISEMLLPFLRSVGLARILGPEQFGLGITLSVVYGIAEQTTDIGINFSAVRADTRGEPGKLYATLQSLMALRGAGLAAVLILASPLMAWAFSAPQVMPAYALLGVSMFIRSFANLGVKEVMRSYVFWREACVVVGSQIFWTAVTIFAAFVLKNFYAVIIGVLGNVLSYVAISHALSPRRCKFGWDKIFAQEAIAFGRPLMPNGTANAFVQLSDRFVIGSVLGVIPLAVYNVAMVTALLPRNAMAKLLITIFMPAFSNLGLAEAKRIRLYDCWIASLAFLGFSYAIGLISVGPELIQIIFGKRFEITPLVMGFIAINICAKFLDQLPVPASVAYGQTRFIFFGTIASAIGVAFGIGILLLWKNFDVFIIALAIGEILALTWITIRTINLHGLTISTTLVYVFGPILVVTGLVGVRLFVPLTLVQWIAFSWTAGVLAIAAGSLFAMRSGLKIQLVFAGIRRGSRPRNRSEAELDELALGEATIEEIAFGESASKAGRPDGVEPGTEAVG